MIARRTFLTAAASMPLVALLTRPSFAMSNEIYTEGGIAIDGSDAVAYFDGNGPVAGTSAHTVDWKGATWQFTSAENAAKFEADPEAFAPQYGGWCAFALANNALAPTVPEAWTIHEGKLYLNFNLDVRARWSKDIPGYVAKANANWPAVLSA